MAFRMQRYLHKHPESGVYYFRRSVPERLRAILGKTEEKVSFETKDLKIADGLCTLKSAEVQARWDFVELEIKQAAAAGGHAADTPDASDDDHSLSHQKLWALAGYAYREALRMHTKRKGLAGLRAVSESYEPDEAETTRPGALETKEDFEYRQAAFLRHVHEHWGSFVEEFLTKRGIVLDRRGYNEALGTVWKGVQQALKKVQRECGGDYRPDPDAARFPSISAFYDVPDAPQTIDALWDMYVLEAQPKPATVKRWRPAFESLKAFGGTQEIAQIDRKLLVAWKISLLTTDLDRTTINDVYLAAVKAIFNFAEENAFIEHNPATNIKARGKPKAKVREKDLTDDEVRTILAATLRPSNNRISVEHAAARRWVPWLCAYTGARVNEITQMRKQDVLPVSGVLILRITPDAGTVKAGGYRHVPIHPHLIEQGFLEFWRSRPNGPLFYNPKRQRVVSEGSANPIWVRMGQKLAEWVRSLGVTDPNVNPNHGWRHLFKTLGREAGIEKLTLDAIEGHVAKSVGDLYGHHNVQVRLDAILRFPRFAIDTPVVEDPAPYFEGRTLTVVNRPATADNSSLELALYGRSRPPIRMKKLDPGHEPRRSGPVHNDAPADRQIE